MTQTVEVPKRALVQFIDPEGDYFPSYSIDAKGHKHFAPILHKGKDLTEGQILSLFEVVEERTPEEGKSPILKARELFDEYNKSILTKHEAKQHIKNILLSSISEKIETLHKYYVVDGPWDKDSTASAIKDLNYWKEVAQEVSCINEL